MRTDKNHKGYVILNYSIEDNGEIYWDTEDYDILEEAKDEIRNTILDESIASPDEGERIIRKYISEDGMYGEAELQNGTVWKSRIIEFEFK